MLARSSRRFKIRLRVADLFEAAIDFRDRETDFVWWRGSRPAG